MNIFNDAGGPSGSSGPTTINDETGRSDSDQNNNVFPCRMTGCDRVFASVRGRGVHEQRQHKAWYDQQVAKNIENRKAPWSAEEAAILARREAQLTLSGERFINQALVPLFPHRTLEAIKGQRRNQKHKERVLQIVGELGETRLQLSDPITPDDHDARENTIKLTDAVNELFAALGPLKGENFRAGKLEHICRNITKWTVSRLMEELEIYLLEVFPYTPKDRSTQPKRPDSCLRTKRHARRAEYAQTQRAWRRNPCQCLRIILKDKTTSSTPPEEVMVPYWRTVMTTRSIDTPGVGQKRPSDGRIWDPISPEEVKNALPEMTTAPGPDGITARQLRAVPLGILTRIANLFLICGRIPERLLESRTILIPKKNDASEPSDFRPITVSSVLARTFHKILAGRLTKYITLDQRQKAFLPVDGTSENIFKLDMVLRYHRQFFKQVYLASVDIAKAFDSVSHQAIEDTLVTMGVPEPMTEYIMYTYNNSHTRLTCDGWQSELIHPTCGVKQGDPLSPVIFNMIMDRLFRLIPDEVGVDIMGEHINALAFADDLLLVASTSMGLRLLLNTTVDFLAQCGLKINTNKSFTVAIRNVPHKKMSVVDKTAKFVCAGRQLPSMTRENEWKYLGVPFTPEGRSLGKPEKDIKSLIDRLTRAALKPQQRLFALRVVALPSLYHQLVLGNTSLSRLKKIDASVRGAVRKWLALPADTPNAYIHAHYRDGGLSIPSMRWLMPLRRKLRLEALWKRAQTPCPFLEQEIGKAKRRLIIDRHNVLEVRLDVDKLWARLLHESCDGKALKFSGLVPQQHQWIIDGSRFLSGRDFINATKLRIGAMPTKSRSSRGRYADRFCRAGCNEIETLNHILQRCHRTHKARVKRHNAVVAYIRRSLEKSGGEVDEEPHFKTEEGLRKPDLIVRRGQAALVIDAQVVGEQSDLTAAHRRKIDYYKDLEEAIKSRYKTDEVRFTSATLSCRGVWSQASVQDLVKDRVLKKKDLKVISTRTLIGGVYSYGLFGKATTMPS